jgi:hypothetical protein
MEQDHKNVLFWGYGTGFGAGLIGMVSLEFGVDVMVGLFIVQIVANLRSHPKMSR